MWSIAEPGASIEASVTACAKGLRQSELREQLRAELATFQVNNALYRHLANSGQLHTTDQDDYPVSISDEKMHWLYENRLVKSAPGRRIYDSIMQSAPLGLCTYCQQGVPSTLDHFLPRSAHPSLAIDPLNLIPCCKDCNHRLGEFFGRTPECEFLHPYFTPPLGRWLYARVRESTPATVEFMAMPSDQLPIRLQGRIVHQFEKLELSVLYETVSVPELTQIGRRALALEQESAVRDHLREMSQAASFVGVNDRRAVLYETLAHSDWYCRGGFIS
jgi:5-methylcytosine-specific restriction endonuclease McrA